MKTTEMESEPNTECGAKEIEEEEMGTLIYREMSRLKEQWPP